MTQMLYIDSSNILNTLLQDPAIHERIERLRQHHPESADHSRRVALYSIDYALRLGISGPDLENLSRAAILHDYGKIYVPPKVLDKVKDLTESEWEHVRIHPEAGYYELAELSPLSRQIVLDHHQYQARPYPANRKPDRQSSPLTKLISIADCADAIPRTYNGNLTRAEKREIMLSKFSMVPILYDLVESHQIPAYRDEP